MASTSICFCPYAQSRPRVRNPGGSPPKKKHHRPRNPSPAPQLKLPTTTKELSSVGDEATTYTRLPPKEDFSLPSFDSSSYQFASEIKLSDSSSATEIRREIDDLTAEEDEEEERGGEENGGEANWKMNYGKFEIFEVDGEEEDEDEDEQEDDVNWEGLGFKDGETIELSGNEGEFEEINVKEKGVPAVMRCFDRAKIYVKAGNGGNGVVAFRREKYVPMGGPSGGDGGRGGNVYVEVDGSMNSLLPFRNSVHFRAGRGSHGQGRMQAGAKGEDVVVKVAPGTVIREADKEEVLLELLHPGQRALLLPGGRGGRGNASFKSGMNKVPRIAENGEEGPEM